MWYSEIVTTCTGLAHMNTTLQYNYRVTVTVHMHFIDMFALFLLEGSVFSPIYDRNSYLTNVTENIKNTHPQHSAQTSSVLD